MAEDESSDAVLPFSHHAVEAIQGTLKQDRRNIGHAHMFRPCLRSVFEEVHVVMRQAWELKQVRIEHTVPLLRELIMGCLLLPFAEMRFGASTAPWSPSVICSDASPGGHGLAYRNFNTEEVQGLAKQACHKGDSYGLFGVDGFVRFQEKAPSIMKKIEVDLMSLRWSLVARPGFYRHITLEEASAHCWSLERRLHSEKDHGARVLHIGDNAAEVGASVRGRSASRRLNRFCKMSCSIEIAGNMQVFRLWVDSKGNPAYHPSPVFGIRAAKTASTYERVSLDPKLAARAIMTQSDIEPNVRRSPAATPCYGPGLGVVGAANP